MDGLFYNLLDFLLGGHSQGIGLLLYPYETSVFRLERGGDFFLDYVLYDF
jgi:hypothetical protein